MGRRLARASSQQFPNPPLTGCQARRAICVLCGRRYDHASRCHVGVSPSSTRNPSPLPPRMRSRSSSLSMQLIIFTCARIYCKESVLIQNNGDKLYRGKLTRAADEKLMINELGPNVCRDTDGRRRGHHIFEDLLLRLVAITFELSRQVTNCIKGVKCTHCNQ